MQPTSGCCWPFWPPISGGPPSFGFTRTGPWPGPQGVPSSLEVPRGPSRSLEVLRASAAVRRSAAGALQATCASAPKRSKRIRMHGREFVGAYAPTLSFKKDHAQAEYKNDALQHPFCASLHPKAKSVYLFHPPLSKSLDISSPMFQSSRA